MDYSAAKAFIDFEGKLVFLILKAMQILTFRDPSLLCCILDLHIEIPLQLDYIRFHKSHRSNFCLPQGSNELFHCQNGGNKK